MSDSPLQLMERLRAGDHRALAKAISLVEAREPLAFELLSACFPFSGAALKIGITGAPGAGKSTLVERLARQYREAGKTVGVVAVDPTSPFTGGAILGDRIRFQGLANDPGFYARSMATRGALGGLARRTADVAMVIEASGKDVLLIETVGVGQDEVAIARLADITLVALVPGMGDDVQGLKAGILEIADIFVVNKSDHDGADQLEGVLREAMTLGPSAKDAGWAIPVVRTVASAGSGIAELMDAINGFWEWLGLEGRLHTRRAGHWRSRILEMVQEALLQEMRAHGLSDRDLNDYSAAAVEKRKNPYLLVPSLVKEMRG